MGGHTAFQAVTRVIETPGLGCRRGPVWRPPPSTGGCNGNLGARCSRGSGKTNFLWQRERCHAVDTADYFSCSLIRRGWGGGEKRARKRGKLNPHVLSLLKGPDSKPEMKLRLQFWLLAGLLPASPSLRARRPHRGEFDPMFHKALCVRGWGAMVPFCLHRRV